MSRAQTLLLWGSTVAGTVTGLVYAWSRYIAQSDDPFSAYNHPVQPWSRDLHIVLAPLLLFAVGWFWGNHVAPKLGKGPPARLSGLWLIGLLVVMAASGYLRQVASAPALGVALAWIHGVSGTTFALLLVGHALSGRAAARAQQREPRRDEGGRTPAKSDATSGNGGGPAAGLAT